MNGNIPNILVIDDDRITQDILRRQLGKLGYEVVGRSSGEEGLVELERAQYDIVLLDVVMPGMDGIDVLRSIVKKYPDQMVIMLTANATIEGAVEALRVGAYDYYRKPLDLGRIQVALKNAVETANLRHEVSNLRGLLNHQYSFDRIVGAEHGLRHILNKVSRVASSTVPVLIRGESGTGKELIARAIHYNGSRQARPFITINCSAIPDNLLESELFGHEKGAFTGAVTQKKGRFERANGGTLFLDEIGDMKLELQAKLLRVLQEQEFERVGGSQAIKVDVRIISATHQNLEEKIEKGEFREDLYYRLSVYPVTLPPLRERVEDLPDLVQSFVLQAAESEGKQIVHIEPEVLRALKRHPWPGNIRELQNVIRRAVVDCEGTTLRLSHLPRTLGGSGAMTEDSELLQVAESNLRLGRNTAQLDGAADGPSIHATPTGSSPSQAATVSSAKDELLTSQEILPFEEYERRIILRALEQTGGDPGRAGELLDISRATIYRKIQKFGIELRGFKE